MALFSKDAVAAAKKAVEDTEAALRSATKRAAETAARIEAFAGRAAEIDPDADASGFASATRELADLRASAEILVVRRTTAGERVEAARAALVAAERAEGEARLAALDGEIRKEEALAMARVGAFVEGLRTIRAAQASRVAAANAVATKLSADPYSAMGHRGSGLSRLPGGTDGDLLRSAATLADEMAARR